MRQKKQKTIHSLPKRKDHKGGIYEDHGDLINKMLADPVKFKLPEFVRVDVEKRITQDGFDFEPDLVLYHKDNSVTVIEVSTTPYQEKKETDESRLTDAYDFFTARGIECNCRWAYLNSGKYNIIEPIKFAFMRVEAERKGLN